MTDLAIASLAPVVGTRSACAALGEPRAAITAATAKAQHLVTGNSC